MNLDELVARLDARKAGTGWAARCPAHDDSTPSLSIDQGDDGRILLHCQAGCETGAVLAAVGLTMRDLYPPKDKARRGGIVATYDYTDETGALLFQVVRYGDPKTFRQRRPDKLAASGWTWNLKGVRRVLYRLPEVLSAIENGRTVFVAEGEKDTDALRAAGEVATCNPMGAGKWSAAHAATLKGAAEVVVVADNDAAGLDHAHKVAESLGGKVGHLLVVHALTGKDAADHLGAGHTVNEFDVLYDSATPPPPPAGDLGRLLDDLAGLIARYVAFPTPGACTAVTLWAAHCHVVMAFDSTPRLVLVSPEKQSGKTRTLEVLELVTPNPRHGVNLTAAALFRAVALEQPTLLFDEADTVFGTKAVEHEELRGLVNAGHRKGAMAYRCVGDPKNMEVKAFPAFCAVALAAIGDLPDTIIDRAVVIKMRRRAPNETVAPFRQRIARKEGAVLRDQLDAWAKTASEPLGEAWPAIPEGLADRSADVWEPLLAIADMAAGDWPDRARLAALKLNNDRMAADVSLGLRLLTDLRTLIVVDMRTDRVFTDTILEYLNGLEESPWGNLRGKLLDARGLARRLKRYDVYRKQIRIGDKTGKGYVLNVDDGDDGVGLADAFDRYLPPLPTREKGNKGNIGNKEPT